MKISIYLSGAMLALLFEACNGSGVKRSAATDSAITRTDSGVLAASGAHGDSSDVNFAEKAAMSGMAEVALGKLAQARSENPQVRQFGQIMVTEHGNANEELKKIAAAKQIRLPSVLDEQHQEVVDSLARLNGREFDRKYADAMIDGHQKAMALLGQETKEGKDSDLKDFAIRTGSVVMHHLSMINGIRRRLK